MAELKVGLGERSYPIIIEPGCLARVAGDLAEKKYGNRYAVITDTTVATLYGEHLLKMLTTEGIEAGLFAFPAGEQSKNLATVADLVSRMVQAGFDRHDCVIALGGGVPGDVGGFVASLFMRGIPFVQVPTTLLAQVDSSVGGKTGVDIPEGKNLVGAFYQPKAVYIDTDVLATLPREELLGGLAEVIKYGVIRDAEFLTFLENSRERILRLEPELIVDMIRTCCQIKADVVGEDEREGGVRKILNYGHTIGHAVEAASKFQIVHGHAVAIGMVAAAKLSVLRGVLSAADSERIQTVISVYGLPVSVPGNLDRQVIKDYLKTDKKAVRGSVFYILPDTVGSTYLTDDVSESMVDEVLQQA